jgi:hypothetical protein
MSIKQWLAIDAPASWEAVAMRTVTTTIVGWVVFQLKEFSETGGFDTPDAFLGAAWLAVLSFIASSLMKMSRKKAAP